MIVESNGIKFGMDNRLYNQLQSFTIKALKKKDNNKIFLVCGDTGIGKSAFTNQMGAVCDPKFSLKNIQFTIEEMKDGLRSLINQSVIFDEAFRGASGRSTMSKGQKELLQMLYEIRQLNQIIFLVAPSFFRLDEAIAVELADGMFYVYKTRDNRRAFRMFNKKKMVDLYYKAKKVRKSYALIPTMVNGRFPDTYVVNEQQYRRKKFKSLHYGKDNIEDKTTNKELTGDQVKEILKLNANITKPIPITQLSYILSPSERSLQRYRKEILENPLKPADNQ